MRRPAMKRRHPRSPLPRAPGEDPWSVFPDMDGHDNCELGSASAGDVPRRSLSEARLRAYRPPSAVASVTRPHRAQNAAGRSGSTGCTSAPQAEQRQIGGLVNGGSSCREVKDWPRTGSNGIRTVLRIVSGGSEGLLVVVTGVAVRHCPGRLTTGRGTHLGARRPFGARRDCGGCAVEVVEVLSG
jgi:hypothetical protein